MTRECPDCGSGLGHNSYTERRGREWGIEGAGKMLIAWATVLAVLLSVAVGQWWK